MLSILVCQLLLVAVCLGVSELTILVFGKTFGDLRSEWVNRFWLGFAVLLAILQYWSLFLPLNNWAFVPISAVGLGFAMLAFRHAKNQGILPSWKTLLTDWRCLAIGLLFLFNALSSSLLIQNGDTLLYHYNAVSWANEFAAVPGLANLHFRLGFNSTFHVFAAFVDNLIWHGRSGHVVNGFILLALEVDLLLKIWRRETAPELRMIFLVMFALLFLRGLTPGVNSLTQDIAGTCLLVKLATLFLELKDRKHLMLLLLLACVNLSIKLTTSFASAAVALYVLVQILKSPSGTRSRMMTTSILIGITYLGGFIARNLIISGHYFFPFPIPGPGFEWEVPYAQVLDIIDDHRKFFGVSVGIFARLLQLPKFLAHPSYAMACLGLLISLKPGLISYPRKRYYALVSVFFLGLVSWFVNFPDPRFGEGYIITFLSTASLGLSMLVYRHLSARVYLAAAAPIAVILLFIFKDPTVPGFIKDDLIYKISHRPPVFYLPPGVDRSESAHLNLGDEYVRDVFIPVEQSKSVEPMCGYSPLPCVHYFKLTKLKWRQKGNLSKGFTVDLAKAARRS